MAREQYSPEMRQLLLRLARETIAAGLTGKPPAGPANLPAALREKRACFVTLHVRDGHQLRGCIGSLTAHAPLAEDVAENAHGAAFEDPRFPPVSSLRELAGLEIEISVLTPPKPIAAATGFEPGRHGIIMRVGGRSAVFLPQVATEQGWDRETTLAHLGLKAGVGKEAWRRPDAKFEVFEAIVMAEEGKPA